MSQNVAKEIDVVNIEDELKKSYLDYAMSVIIGRALPDVRDGLKPVHRRALYAMKELSNDWNKPYKKSARIVGDVIGKYHPHGDTAVYDTIVRMAQPFSMRYILVDGQGNFGSIDGDSAAAMRYTEIRMSRMAHELLSDLDKDTVDFEPNYDGSEQMPSILPSRVPNLLVNGSSGIAVGMATNIPPHHLGEVINGCIALIDDSSLNIDDLMQYIKGPDFPTKGIIHGRSGIVDAYKTGRGRVHVRARTEIETNESNNKVAIIVTELPYQVNKARLLEKIAELVREKKLEGISALRDESDKDGMRVVIELKRGEMPEIVINNLYAQTQMQTMFGVNMVALDNGRPHILNLKEILSAFIAHRREVVTRRTIFELKKARDRSHILEGLSVALTSIDDVIALIKASPSPVVAKQRLLDKPWVPGQIVSLLEQSKNFQDKIDYSAQLYGLFHDGYHLSPVQAQAILDLRLHRLTGLEQDKIFEEYKELLEIIKDLLDILSSVERLMSIIRLELIAVKEQFNDERQTEIIDSQQDLTREDLIAEQEMVVTISHEGYAKTQALSDYQSQRRGGKGKIAATLKEDDFIDQLVIANTHDMLLCFSNKGKLYWIKVYQIPQASRNSRGKPLVNLLRLDSGERVSAILPVKSFDEDRYVFMATSKGKVKKVSLMHFSRPRLNGIISINLADDDELVGVDITQSGETVMLFSDSGKAIRFDESEVRPVGRTAGGCIGMRLKKNNKVIALCVIRGDGSILTATENGYGKRSSIDEYRIIGRAGQGVISIQISERNGNVIGAVQVDDSSEIMLITQGGTLVRTRASEISVIGRNTQGVRLINLSGDEKLIGLDRVIDVENVEC